MMIMKSRNYEILSIKNELWTVSEMTLMDFCFEYLRFKDNGKKIKHYWLPHLKIESYKSTCALQKKCFMKCQRGGTV